MKNWKDIENKFRDWAIGTVQEQKTIYQYIKNSMNKKIPEKLRELKEKDETFKSIFQISDIQYLNNLSKRLLGGDLTEFNRAVSSQEPSAAVNKYIKFLEKVALNKNIEDKVINTKKHAKNQILYGPPGTGKTFNTVNKTLEIIFEKENKEQNFKIIKESIQYDITYQQAIERDNREALNAIFDLYKAKGQIDFVTFHQSYGYEEFVEGIKADLKSNDIKYILEKGIFKKLCEEASLRNEIKENEITIEENTSIWKMSLGDSLTGEDKIYYEEAINTDTIIMGYGNGIDFSKCKNLDEIKQKTDNTSTINAIDRFKHQLKTGDIVIISDGNRKFKAIVQVIGEYFFDMESNLTNKRKIRWLKRFTSSKDAKEISNRYFTQTTLNKPQGIEKNKLQEYLNDTKVIDNTEKNYILIIDEINRGNISKIFGELITLLEDSKRVGEDEEIKVTLPYSGKDFGVPNNLYILGTMNTADRSIALMDTALRRRFEFTEMMPDVRLLEDKIINDINIENLLTKINQRIEYLYDRDHTIGHAYFISLKDNSTLEDLENIFRNKIIPLLQEYFYDDWEKIRLILADNQKSVEYQFIKVKNENDYNFNKLFGEVSEEVDIQEETKIFEINDDAFKEKNSYIKIYSNT